MDTTNPTTSFTRNVSWNTSSHNAAATATTLNPSNNDPTTVDYFILVQGILTFIVNASLFIMITTERKLRSKKANKFFLNLLTVHCALSVVTIIAQFYTPSTKRVFKNGILIAMFLSLTANSLDRYFCITSPFKYQRLKTRHVLMVIACTWLPALISICLAASLGITKYHCTVICSVLICVAAIVLSITNVTIYKIARSHVIVIKQTSIGKENLAKPGNVSGHFKACFVCFAVVSTFIVLWSPYLVHNVLTLAGVYKPSGNALFTVVVVKLSFLNSFVDPFLFVLFNKNARKEVKKLLKIRRSNLDEGYQSTFTTASLKVCLPDQGVDGGVVLR